MRTSERVVRPSLVAREALLLWPRRVGVSVTTIQEPGLWPVFAMVLAERDPDDDPAVAPLYDLLDRPEHLDHLSVIEGRCEWTVIDPRLALLELTVHATAPVRFDVDIILPARPVLSTLGLLARGGTVAITTPRHGNAISGRVDIREALNKLVLFSCPPSAELAALADVIGATVR